MSSSSESPTDVSGNNGGCCKYCQESPPVVNLSSSLSSSSFDNNDDASSKNLLHRNLEFYGWSPITIDKLTTGDVDADRSTLLLQPPSRQEILNLFQNTSELNEAKSIYEYRAAESGAQGDTSVEPKESLEVKLRNIDASSGASYDSGKTSRIDEWCLGLSKIAHLVCQHLDMPSNTMLPSISKDADNKSLDLMRIFYYHATSDTSRIGSSPHTDWGSWTIVWQDSVGGLQTYCRSCGTWIPIRPPQSDENSKSTTWNCIVHVGDMASLALTATQRQSKEAVSLSFDGVNNIAASKCHSHCAWPSPKHRVLTSTTQERASLVYFGYPPANSTLKEISDKLHQDWTKSKSSSRRLPLQEYYLLQNQSTAESSEQQDAEVQARRLYESMKFMSIQDIIQEKWNQVQRTS